MCNVKGDLRTTIFELIDLSGGFLSAWLVFVLGGEGAGYMALFGMLLLLRLYLESEEAFGIRRNRRIYREERYY